MRQIVYSLVLMLLSVATLLSAGAGSPTVAVLDFHGDGQLAQAAREEAQAGLKRAGYRLVVATSGLNQDLSNLQREIDVQASPYAEQGENHPEKGYFRGANFALQGSASMGHQHQSFSVLDTAFRIGGVTTDHRKVSVDVNLNLVDIRTREQLAHGKASSTKRYTDNSNSIWATDTYDKALRKAIAEATDKALRELLRDVPNASPSVPSSRRR